MARAHSWQQVMKQRSFIIQLCLSLAALLIIALLIPHFFSFIQKRNGYVLNDPLLNMLRPKDLSNITFMLIYAAILFSFIVFAFSPLLFLHSIQAYCILTIIRVVCILIVPLNPPSDIIVLNDPFVQWIGYGGQVITKDLFFSGHTSTLFLLFLASPYRVLKIFLLIAAIAVASLLLIQHVHYLVDILAAPLFALLSYKLAFGWNKTRQKHNASG